MIDYKQGLKQLVQLARSASWFQECALYEARLHDNLSEERFYGATEQTRSNRAQIVEQLNRLAHQHLHVSFVDLCIKKYDSNQHLKTAHPSSLLEQRDQPSIPLQTTPILLPRSEGVSTLSPLKVFVGYSYKDRLYLEELCTHLAHSIRSGEVECWNDAELNPTDFWREELTKTLMIANIAILLVSAHFLASNFITHGELPYLLMAAESKKLTIISVIVRPCRFEDTGLAHFKAINPPTRPLSVMNPSERDTIWVKIAEYIKHAR